MTITKERLLSVSLEALALAKALREIKAIASNAIAFPERAPELVSAIVGYAVPDHTNAISEAAILQHSWKRLEARKRQQARRRLMEDPPDARVMWPKWQGGNMAPQKGAAPAPPRPAPPTSTSTASEAWKQAMLHPTTPAKPEPEACTEGSDKVIISKEGKEVIERHLDYDPRVLDPSQLAPGKTLF